MRFWIILPLLYATIGMGPHSVSLAAPSCPKLQDLLQTHQSIISTYRESEGLIRFITWLQNRTLIPEGSTVHVVGPGNDYYQWATFLLIRPDIKQLIISELPSVVSRIIDFEDQWLMIETFNAQLIAHSSIKTYEAFHQLALEKIWYSPNVEHTHFLTAPPNTHVFPHRPLMEPLAIPEADLVVSVSPIPKIVNSPFYFTHLKQNGLFWLVTEHYNNSNNVLRDHFQNPFLKIEERYALFLPRELSNIIPLGTKNKQHFDGGAVPGLSDAYIMSK